MFYLINNHFLNYLLKIKKKLIEISKNLNDYTTGNLLDYNYFFNHYKLIAIDLSQQNVKLKGQQTNFVGKLSQDATTILIIKKAEKTELIFKQNSVDIS